MKIKAEIVCDSIGPNNVRITTMRLTFHRFLLPEFNTHRMFSRNASSSRAIPTSKMIEMAKKNPAMPLQFTKNQKGMQASEMIDDQEKAIKCWLDGRDAAIVCAKSLESLGVHKQHLNRVLEPYLWTTVICTATDWDNFFALRCHHMAQPEICELAMQAYEAYVSNKPKQLQAEEWHIPFITQEVELETHFELGCGENKEELIKALIKRSVAKCARVSYLNHEGKPSTLTEDFALYDRLLGSAPIHASPAEHQAQAREVTIKSLDPWETSSATVYSGNLRGWIQFRKTLSNENVTEFKGPVLKP